MESDFAGQRTRGQAGFAIRINPPIRSSVRLAKEFGEGSYINSLFAISMTIQSLFQTMEEEVQSSGWRPDFETSPVFPPLSRQELVPKVIAAYSPFAQSVCLALSTRLKTGQLPALSPPESYYALIVLSSVSRFLEGFLIWDGKTSATIFPFPECPENNPDSVALWLVTDWWALTGLQQFAWDKSRDLSRVSGTNYEVLGEAVVFQAHPTIDRAKIPFRVFGVFVFPCL